MGKLTLLRLREVYQRSYVSHIEMLLYWSLANILIITITLMAVGPSLIATLHEEWGLPLLNQIIRIYLGILTLLVIRGICLNRRNIAGSALAHFFMLGSISLSIILTYYIFRANAVIEDRLYSEGLPNLLLGIVPWSIWLHGCLDIAVIVKAFSRLSNNESKKGSTESRQQKG